MQPMPIRIADNIANESPRNCRFPFSSMINILFDHLKV